MKTSGFTLVELIAIMVLIGILSAIAAPRIFSTQTFSGRGFYDQSLAMMRYAQKVAVAQRTNVFANVDTTNNRVCLTFVTDPGCSGAAGTYLVNPADNAIFRTTAPAGTTLSTTVSSFSFSGLGRPSQGASITVTYDGLPHVITVEAETGYVH